MALTTPFRIKAALLGSALVALTGCTDGFDFDMRHLADGFSTTDAVNEQRTADRPEPDGRGIISYPTYQVAVARRGDTISDLAARIGLPVAELASYNGLPAEASLRNGEVIALPRRVAESTAGPITPVSTDTIDITTLAGDAIDRADSPTVASTPSQQTGEEPSRHQVKRGETAYSIARTYGVSVRALSDWNGLDSGLAVREGQYLLIPVVTEVPSTPPVISQPGDGSLTPVPPSALDPLPDENVVPVTASVAPASPDLATTATAASAAAMILPTQGRIIRAFEKGSTDGIDISASAGATVVAAAAGTVAAITRDTDQVPILVIRHANNVLTVYANIDNITVSKGDSVASGQKVAEVRASDSTFLHFQVREGTQSVDPQGYLN